MEFLGVGPFELLLILIVALVVVGPERLPVLARQAGKILVTVRDWVQKSPDAAMILRARQEIESELANIRESLAEVQNARDEVVNAARQMNTLVQEDVIGSTRSAIDEIRTGTVARSTKPNGIPVDPGAVSDDDTIPNIAPDAIDPTEPTLIAPDGSVLLEVEPGPETATIARPRTSGGAVDSPDLVALQAQIAMLTSELRALQVQLQERGVITSSPSTYHNGNGAHPIESSEQIAPVDVPVTEEQDDVNQPAYSRD